MWRLNLAAACVLALCEVTVAGHLSGVTMPDTLAADDMTLVLNGMGQRKKMWIEVYVGGLYLPERSTDAAKVLGEGSPWKLVMHFLYKKVDKDKLDEAWMDGFRNNTPEILSSHPAEVERFLACFPAMLKGQEVVLTYLPEAGLKVEIEGELKETFASAPFARAVLSIWLGPKPPSDDLKKGLLGTA